MNPKDLLAAIAKLLPGKWKTEEEMGEDVPVSEEMRQMSVTLMKQDAEKQIVYGVVLDPYVIDLQDDWVPPKDVEETAHDWLIRSRTIGLMHEQPAQAVPVESYLVPYPSPEDYEAAMRNEPHSVYEMRLGDGLVHSGSWVLATKVLDPQLWADITSGRLDAYSIGGFGVRREMQNGEMPDVNVVTSGETATD